MFPLNVVAAAGEVEEPLPPGTEHLMFAGLGGPDEIGFGAGSFGSMAPEDTAGLQIRTLVSTVGVVDFVFSLLGKSLPDDDSTFRQLRITGPFASGQGTKLIDRSSLEYSDTDNDDTSWFTGDFNDAFLQNAFYDVIIHDREEGGG